MHITEKMVILLKSFHRIY